jgi:hypothetical protein
MRESKIFTNVELKYLEKRKAGSKEDKTGLFSARIKPKIKELLTLDLESLKKLID